MAKINEFYVSEKTRKATKNRLKSYFPDEISSKVSNKIEKGIYDYSEQFSQTDNSYLPMAQAIYEDTVSNILFNLEQNSNTIKEIKRGIRKKIYNPYNLAFLRPHEMDKDKWMQIMLRKSNMEERLNNLPTLEWKPCLSCKNRKYFYYQLQTRSADEPMTVFHICKNCGKTYRFNN